MDELIDKMAAVLCEARWAMPYATIQLIRDSEPEEVARVMHVRALQARHSADLTLWMLMAMS